MSSTNYDAPAQYERDFRSANKEWKRTKDATAKWHLGYRPSPGVRSNLRGEMTSGSASQQEKIRPALFCNMPPKKVQNVVKTHSRGNWDMPASRVRSKFNAADEIRETSRSIADLLPAVAAPHSSSYTTRQMTASADGILYSFDRDTTMPAAQPQSLDVFVKTNGRDTEKLVEKEYEILDANGQALKGRKARRVLRQTASGSGGSGGAEVEEDEGFELV